MIRHDRYFRMGKRILQDGEDPTQKRRQKVFLHSLFSIVCCMGGKLADVGKRYSKDISRGDKGRTFFFQRGGQSGMNSLLAPGLQPFSPHFSTQKSGKPEIFSVNCEEKRFRSLTLI